MLSFIPSSLMLGVTTHISTDVAAVPLLWVLPLAMYLGTFVLAFSPREVLPHRWLIRLLPVLIAGCLATVLLNTGSVVVDPSAPGHVLRLRDGLPSRAGESQTRCPTSDRVLHLDVVRRDAGRRVQRPRRSADLLQNSGIPAGSRSGNAGEHLPRFRKIATRGDVSPDPGGIGVRGAPHAWDCGPRG